MNSYSQQLAALHTAAIGGDAAPMLALMKTARAAEISLEERLNVYQSGYTQRLIETVKADYPTLAHYLGSENFEILAAAYVQATPSNDWDLNFYSFGLADFLRTHLPDAAAHDLASLESAIAEVFWLPDSAPLTADILAQLSPEALSNQQFKLRTACRLLALNHGVNDYLTAFRSEQPLLQLAAVPEYLAIIRHHNEVQRIVLATSEYQILYRLAQGIPFGAALDTVAELPETDINQLSKNLPGYLAHWLKYGFFRKK